MDTGRAKSVAHTHAHRQKWMLPYLSSNKPICSQTHNAMLASVTLTTPPGGCVMLRTQSGFCQLVGPLSVYVCMVAHESVVDLQVIAHESVPTPWITARPMPHCPITVLSVHVVQCLGSQHIDAIRLAGCYGLECTIPTKLTGTLGKGGCRGSRRVVALPATACTTGHECNGRKVWCWPAWV